MKLKGLTRAELDSCLDRVNLFNHAHIIYNREPEGSKVLNFTLRLTDSTGKYHRLGQHVNHKGNRRRMVSLCWHGHRDVMGAIFLTNPEARLSSVCATYHGLRDFLNKYVKTGHRNIGSIAYPLAMADACEC